MAGRSSKSVLTISGHLTKREIALRKAGEAAALSGEPMRERADVRKIPEAHKEFVRLRRLLQRIQKADALYREVISDYCLLHAECMAIPARLDRIRKDLDYLEEKAVELDPIVYYKLRAALYGHEAKISAELDRKRDRKRRIEDKNLMTLQAALRAVPEKREHRNPLKEALEN